MDHTDHARDWYFLQNKEIELLKENSWNPDETKKSNNILQIDEVKKVDGFHDLTFMCVRLDTNCKRSSILNMYDIIMKDVKIHREEDFLYQGDDGSGEEEQENQPRSYRRKRKATGPPNGQRPSKRRRISPSSSSNSTTTLGRKKGKRRKKKRKKRKTVRPQDVVNGAIVIDEEH